VTTPATLEGAAVALAAEHYATRRTLVESVLATIAEWWAYISRSDITGSWDSLVGPGITSVVREGQRLAAVAAPDYVTAMADVFGVLDPPELELVPDMLYGQAYDGRSLDSLVDQGRISSLQLIHAGLPPEEALAAGLAKVQRAALTETQDAGRGADQLVMTTHRVFMGYVRFLQLPSCARCVILAGRTYRWSSGFQRHPLCDCLHVPTLVASGPEAHKTLAAANPEEAVRQGMVRGLTKADQKALADGADLGSLVNLKRSGLSIAGDGTRRRGKRLTPESIYRQAGSDREKALTLLKRNGYLA
jgi:hypothetical protein